MSPSTNEQGAPESIYGLSAVLFYPHHSPHTHTLWLCSEGNTNLLLTLCSVVYTHYKKNYTEVT